MVGEHIRTRRDGHWTHAIDCGDETVIHLVEEAPGATRVRRSYRPLFVSGAETVEVVTHRQRTFPANEIVARAYSRIADPGLASMFRDSEAFAEWCATGRLPAGPANVAVGVPAVGSTAAPEREPPEPREPSARPGPAKARPAASPPPPAKRRKLARKAAKPSKRAAPVKARRAAPKRAAKKAAAPARKKGSRPAAKAKRAR